MLYRTDARHERFWRVGIARNAWEMLCFSRLRRLAKSASKNGSCGGSAAQDGDKICIMLWRENDFCEKKAPRCMFGALLEVELRKICATFWRESALEVKIVKNWQARSTFGSWAAESLRHAAARAISAKKRHHIACSEHFWKLGSVKFQPRCGARAIWKSKSLKSDGLGLGTFLEVQSAFRVASAIFLTCCKNRGKRRSLRGMQKRWQARWIWKGSETMLFRMAGARISWSVMSMFEASDAESVEGLHNFENSQLRRFRFESRNTTERHPSLAKHSTWGKSANHSWEAWFLPAACPFWHCQLRNFEASFRLNTVTALHMSMPGTICIWKIACQHGLPLTCASRDLTKTDPSTCKIALNSHSRTAHLRQILEKGNSASLLSGHLRQIYQLRFGDASHSRLPGNFGFPNSSSNQSPPAYSSQSLHLFLSRPKCPAASLLLEKHASSHPWATQRIPLKHCEIANEQTHSVTQATTLKPKVRTHCWTHCQKRYLWI